ncbi:MAG: selenium-dependent molybdenum cofactor biosynthesis protein YqeB [Chloroflexi bacterium]|nr:selenium-dependent molybdenum cofactor biosynthesis protein YqeB [Chloroflexota bacterium]
MENTTRERPIAVVKGGGDLGSGVAWRLWKVGFRVICTDIAQPLVIRRTVAFSSAIYEGRALVEGVSAWHIGAADEAFFTWAQNALPVIVDPEAHSVETYRPEVVVDAIMAKRNTGTTRDQAPCVVALGPGFTAGADCHAIVETQRGHDLGRVLWTGAAAPNTGVPGVIGGEGEKRVVRAPVDGLFYGRRAIGDVVKVGEVIASIDQTQVTATIGGVLRGMLHDRVHATAGLKIADIDPRGERSHCYTISDKALAIAGGVLEAVFAIRRIGDR